MCIAVVHFTEINCCNAEITYAIFVIDNRIVSMFLFRRVSQPSIALGCEDTIRFSNTIRTFVISYYSKWFRWSARPQCTLNPLSPKSDLRQISPCNISALQNRVVMRIKDMITQDESNWYFNKFSPLLLLKTYRDNKWEFEFWSSGLKG